MKVSHDEMRKILKEATELAAEMTLWLQQSGREPGLSTYLGTLMLAYGIGGMATPPVKEEGFVTAARLIAQTFEEAQANATPEMRMAAEAAERETQRGASVKEALAVADHIMAQLRDPE